MLLDEGVRAVLMDDAEPKLSLQVFEQTMQKKLISST